MYSMITFFNQRKSPMYYFVSDAVQHCSVPQNNNFLIIN